MRNAHVDMAGPIGRGKRKWGDKGGRKQEEGFRCEFWVQFGGFRLFLIFMVVVWIWSFGGNGYS